MNAEDAKNPLVVDLIKGFMRDHGYTGLYNEDSGCGCSPAHGDMGSCCDGVCFDVCKCGHVLACGVCAKSQDCDFLRESDGLMLDGGELSESDYVVMPEPCKDYVRRG